MNEDLWKVDVSAIKLYKKPDVPSNIMFSKNTLVMIVDTFKLKNQLWAKVRSVKKPIIEGYMLKKYLTKI